MKVNVRFDEDYAIDYAWNVIAGTLENIPQLGELTYGGQQYIAAEAPYPASYGGSISGTWKGLTDEQRDQYRLKVYCITDEYYLVDTVTLPDGGFWQATAEYGSREIRLEDEKGGIVDYAYPYLTDYVVDIYAKTDAEYLQDTCRIWRMGGEYRFYSSKARYGEKIAKVRRVSDGEIVGVSGVAADEKTLVWDFDKNAAAQDALAFIKRQMNTSRFTHTLRFGADYGEDHEGQMMWCRAEGFGRQDARVAPQYIAADQFYDPGYSGVISGTWQGIDDPTQYAVDIYEVTDRPYLVCSCPLMPDGTWRSQVMFMSLRATQEEVITDYFFRPVAVNAGSFKDIRLVRKNWEGIPAFDPPGREIAPNDGLLQPGREMLVRMLPGAVDEEIIERPYAKYRDYSGKFYTYTDTEYLSDSCEVFDAGGFAFFFTTAASAGRKIAKLTRESGGGYTVVGMCGAAMKIDKGRFPASFLIPSDDPQYDRDGSSAQSRYGYMLGSRCFIYDAGLALIAFTLSHDHALCREMLDRLREEQNADGSFNFSYDNYIGQLFEGYVRTGALGWLVHGMCYYTLKTGDRQYLPMIRKAGDWLLSRQITDEDDPRFGLLTGGYGSYSTGDYSYIAGEIEWCSTEHNCSALQAMTDLSLVFGEEQYKIAAARMKKAIFEKLYDGESARFYQGIGTDGADSAWAVDCCTWAGKTLLSILEAHKSRAVAKTARETFLTSGKSIVVSTEEEHYNTRYSGASVDGAKPYADGYNAPPDIVWSEGTLGYVSLLLALGERSEAEYYLNEMMKLQYCAGSTGGVLYVTETWAGLPWEFHAWESMVSSAWLYILLTDENALFPITAKPMAQPVVGKDGRKRGRAAVRAMGSGG